jgi:hypothetical protein
MVTKWQEVYAAWTCGQRENSGPRQEGAQLRSVHNLKLVNCLFLEFAIYYFLIETDLG